VVVDGSIYVLEFMQRGLNLVRFTPELREIASSVVPLVGDAQVRPGDHEVIVDSQDQSVAFSLDLSDVHAATSHAVLLPRFVQNGVTPERIQFYDGAPCMREMDLGALHTVFCGRFDSRFRYLFVAWGPRND
jgi:hypothetical protein